ncbi:MAG: hypothetical protein A2Y62_11290 [Candidatus Fischerbacteria bacterium RBG_13_37_8]|uniref:HTH arsR-type domain-containing protein n=1 Tax=Candidatus Fischerbacteria bacterium RBG_13_37_8 TaxID=1817863 RepID=A0A1F5VW98_9BACT|nr:MAG: hypothetical protein A2Y62_11290 [Candidatus Fischerbacteria bacterium RBG_13_37_8]
MKMKLQPSEIFKVLGVETRIRILDLLKEKGPLGAKSIAKTIGVSIAAVSQHLKIMRHAGLVMSQRKGYWIPYSIDEETLGYCRRALNEVCACGCRKTKICEEEDLENASVEWLKEYERYLRKELKRVQESMKGVRCQRRMQ